MSRLRTLWVREEVSRGSLRDHVGIGARPEALATLPPLVSRRCRATYPTAVGAPYKETSPHGCVLDTPHPPLIDQAAEYEFNVCRFCSDT